MGKKKEKAPKKAMVPDGGKKDADGNKKKKGKK